MLLRFGVENYKSLRDYQELSLIAASIKDPWVDLLKIPNSNDSALPAIGIYGANASGKSTLFAALRFFVKGIRNSYTKDKDLPISVVPFALDPEFRTKPSRFDCDVLINDARYHYGYIVDDKEILEEWLYVYPPGKSRASKQTWFYRDSSLDAPFYFGKALKGLNRTLQELTRKDSLFLSTAAANNHKQLTVLHDFFATKIFFRSADTISSKSTISESINSEAKKKLTLKFLQLADTGILNIEVKRDSMPEEAIPFASELRALMQKHLGSDVLGSSIEEITSLEITHQGVKEGAVTFDLDSESTGTQTLLSLLGPVYDVLNEGGLLVLDEMNSNLHPLVSKAIIKLFASSITNVGSGQLIFATHDTNLLSFDVLRRDQIWFAEKDQTGASHIYPLTDIKTRQTDNIEKGYLEGRFGAIPFFNSNC